MNNLEQIEKLLPDRNFSISIEPGSVTCDIEEYKSKIYAITDYLSNLTVTEDSIKEAKKLMARVNHAVKDLNSTRIETKKAYLEPFNQFETELKELEKLVKEANNLVKEQTDYFNEQEREKKRQTLNDIWNKRTEKLEFNGLISFEDFITPKHLNKSVTIKSVETEMATFIDRVNTDIPKLISTCMDNDYPIQEGVGIYKRNYNYGDFLDVIDRIVKVNETIKEQIETPIEEDVYEEPDFVFFKVPFATAGVIRKFLNDNAISYEELIQ